MTRIIAVMLSMALAGSVIAAQGQQESTTPTPAKSPHKKMVAKKSEPAISEQLNEMKLAIDAQQQQIKQLSNLIEGRDQKIQKLEQRLDESQAAAVQAQAKADSAAAQSSQQGQTVMALSSDVTDLKTSATNSALTLQETQKRIGEFDSPASIHFKGITLTPGGFLAAETVYRNRALASETTPFNSVSMPGSGQNDISEFYGSGRQSRIAMLAEGKVSDLKLSGYYEADFLSAGVTSNNNQTNSYTLRQRQAWGQAALNNGWTFTGGQMWTLATETRKGLDNRTEALPGTIDANYNVGFTFARQWGVRAVRNFNNKAWLGASLEDSQTVLTASNNASNFAFGGPGVGGGLYNSTANYSFNAMPDVILKAAFEPGFGHYEVFGIMSRFRDRIYPCVEPLVGATCPSAASGAYNDSKTGGGLGANARFLTLNKKMEFGLHGLFGNGVGRYGAAGLPDATINPDGTMAPLRSYQGLATIEFHLKKFDIYMNAGEEYVGHHSQVDPVSLKVVGYGAPSFIDTGCYTETAPSAATGFGFGAVANCSGQTKYLVEGTFGFWYKIYSGPKGKMQFGPQYSYLSRNAYSGTGVGGVSVAPHGIDNILYTSFRYYLP